MATAQLQLRKADLDADKAAQKIEHLQKELQVPPLSSPELCPPLALAVIPLSFPQPFH